MNLTPLVWSSLLRRKSLALKGEASSSAGFEKWAIICGLTFFFLLSKPPRFGDPRPRHVAPLLAPNASLNQVSGLTDIQYQDPGILRPDSESTGILRPAEAESVPSTFRALSELPPARGKSEPRREA